MATGARAVAVAKGAVMEAVVAPLGLRWARLVETVALEMGMVVRGVGAEGVVAWMAVKMAWSNRCCKKQDMWS